MAKWITMQELLKDFGNLFDLPELPNSQGPNLSTADSTVSRPGLRYTPPRLALSCLHLGHPA